MAETERDRPSSDGPALLTSIPIGEPAAESRARQETRRGSAVPSPVAPVRRIVSTVALATNSLFTPRMAAQATRFGPFLAPSLPS